jgi:hypothetical protein
MKRVISWRTGFVLAACLVAGMPATAGPVHFGANLPPYFDSAARRAVLSWLTSHRDYRVIDDSDCRCDRNLREIRSLSAGVWKADPDYHPYFKVGDFNRDGRRDLAVGLARLGATSQFQVLVIDNYRAGKAAKRECFLSHPFDLGEAMFFGLPRPKPHHLLVGHFDSEGWEFVPKKRGHYVLR